MREIQQLILLIITIKFKPELIIINNPPHLSAEVSPRHANTKDESMLMATLR